MRRICPAKGLATLGLRADVAELVDAHGSGPCGGNPVEVRVLSSAFAGFAAVSREARSAGVNIASTTLRALAFSLASPAHCAAPRTRPCAQARPHRRHGLG